MSWYSEGNEGAEALATTAGNFRKRRNFFTVDGEPAARVRFLKSAQDSFNYKRSFVKSAPKGQEKMQTSYDTPDCPLVKSPNHNLQVAAAWPIIDRRILKFKDRTTQEEKEVGPRVLYFADGIRTRKQLIAFEKEMLAQKNEERGEDGLDPLELEDFNLTHYDVKLSKAKGAPWTIVGTRPKDITKKDEELIEKEPIVLHEELAPMDKAALAQLVGQGAAVEEEASTTQYAYAEDDDTVEFGE